MKESRLYTFIHTDKRFTLHFLEGQKVIHDTILTHNLDSNALSYFRDTLLSSIFLNTNLKVGDTAGFYIDAEEPYFRFKLEISENGQFRTLLLPEELPQIPEKIDGLCRLVKIHYNASPYSSIVKLNQTPAKEITNILFDQSLQINSKTIVSNVVDQSIMISHLPVKDIKQITGVQTDTLDQHIEKNSNSYDSIFQKCLDDFEKIVNNFEDLGYVYLHSKTIVQTCSCSKDRILHTLMKFPKSDQEDLFSEKDEIDSRCDYCNKIYIIKKGDLYN